MTALAHLPTAGLCLCPLLTSQSSTNLRVEVPQGVAGRGAGKMRAAMILMLGCVSDAFMLQPAAPRVLASARHVVHGSEPQMLLPMVSLAGEAVAMKEVPYGLIAAGCVLTTLTAGFPMCATY